MFKETSRVYILVDDKNRIIRLEGQSTLPSNLDGWILIEEGPSCIRLNLAQTNYLKKPLTGDYGVYQYKYINGKIIERTPEEMKEDMPQFNYEISLEERIADLEAALCELMAMK